MYKIYTKRIIELEIPVGTKTPEELLKVAKEETSKEKIISNTFMVLDEAGIILAKEKIVNGGGNGVSFTFDGRAL